MEPDDIINTAYNQIKSAITERLIHQGYQPVHEQRNDPVYDSRYIIWSNNYEALRLTWDGKESWFVLEITESLPLNVHTPWNEILIVPFDSNSGATYIEGVVQQVISSLN